MFDNIINDPDLARYRASFKQAQIIFLALVLIELKQWMRGAKLKKTTATIERINTNGVPKNKAGGWTICSLRSGVCCLGDHLAGYVPFFGKGQFYVTYFDESIQGLVIDSPVKYRGVFIGRVDGISVAPDSKLIKSDLWSSFLSP
jgi:hypothetical protein